MELTYVQSIPLGARNVSMRGNLEMGSGRHTAGRHDQTYEVSFTLTDSAPIELGFSWEGGLAVEPPELLLPLGATSGGLRILDFFLEDDGWVIVLEGDGGRTHPLTLFGEAVETTDDRARPAPGGGGAMVLPVAFSGSGRVQRTLRLKPLADTHLPSPQGG